MGLEKNNWGVPESMGEREPKVRSVRVGEKVIKIDPEMQANYKNAQFFLLTRDELLALWVKEQREKVQEDTEFRKETDDTEYRYKISKGMLDWEKGDFIERQADGRWILKDYKKREALKIFNSEDEAFIYVFDNSSLHSGYIAEAIRDGKDVPIRVLRDYPDVWGHLSEDLRRQVSQEGSQYPPEPLPEKAPEPPLAPETPEPPKEKEPEAPPAPEALELDTALAPSEPLPEEEPKAPAVPDEIDEFLDSIIKKSPETPLGPEIFEPPEEKELYYIQQLKDGGFDIGSKFTWGNEVWEIAGFDSENKNVLYRLEGIEEGDNRLCDIQEFLELLAKEKIRLQTPTSAVEPVIKEPEVPSVAAEPLPKKEPEVPPAPETPVVEEEAVVEPRTKEVFEALQEKIQGLNTASTFKQEFLDILEGVQQQLREKTVAGYQERLQNIFKDMEFIISNEQADFSDSLENKQHWFELYNKLDLNSVLRKAVDNRRQGWYVADHPGAEADEDYDKYDDFSLQTGEALRQIVQENIKDVSTINELIPELNSLLTVPETPKPPEKAVREEEPVVKPSKEKAIAPEAEEIGKEEEKPTDFHERPKREIKEKFQKAREKFKEMSPESKRVLAKVVGTQIYKTVTTILGVKFATDIVGAVFKKGDIYDYISSIKGVKASRKDIEIAVNEILKFQDKEEPIEAEAVEDEGEGEVLEVVDTRIENKKQELYRKIEDNKFLTSEQKQNFREQIDNILKEHQKAETELEDNRQQEVRALTKAYINGKVSGWQITKDGLNLALTAGGLLTLRGAMYAGTSLAERVQKASRKHVQERLVQRTEVSKLSYILKDVTVNAARETIQGLTFTSKTEAGEKKTGFQKSMDFVKAAGMFARAFGIGGTAFRAFSESGGQLSSAGFEDLIKAINGHDFSEAVKQSGENLVANAQHMAYTYTHPVETIKQGVEGIKQAMSGKVEDLGVKAESIEAKPDSTIAPAVSESATVLTDKYLDGLPHGKDLNYDEPIQIITEKGKFSYEHKTGKVSVDSLKAVWPVRDREFESMSLDDFLAKMNDSESEVYQTVGKIVDVKNIPEVSAEGEVREPEEPGKPVEPAKPALSPEIAQGIASLQAHEEFAPHLPAGEQIAEIGTVSKGGSVSQALDKVMAKDATVTVINPDGTVIENFDANLVHEGDTVVETKDGQILVYKSSEVAVKEGMSLEGRYDEIEQQFKLKEIPQEVKDAFNLDKAKGGFYERLNYSEAKAARDFWDTHQARISGLSSEHQAQFYQAADFHDAESIQSVLANLERQQQLEAYIAKSKEVEELLIKEREALPKRLELKGDEYQELDLDLDFNDKIIALDTNNDGLPNVIRAQTEDGVTYFDRRSPENLSGKALEDAVADAHRANKNLTELTKQLKLKDNRTEAANFYGVWGMGKGVQTLDDFAKEDFKLVNNFTKEVGFKDLDRLKLEGNYSSEKFALASRIINDKSWERSDLRQLLDLTTDKQQLAIANSLLKRGENFRPVDFFRALDITQRTEHLNFNNDLTLAELAAKGGEGKIILGEEVERLFGKEVNIKDAYVGADKLTFAGARVGDSAEHTVTLDIKNNQLFITRGSEEIQKVALTDKELDNVEHYLKGEAPPVEQEFSQEVLDLQKQVEANLGTKFTPETITALEKDGYKIIHDYENRIGFVKELSTGDKLVLVILKDGEYRLDNYTTTGPEINLTKGNFKFNDSDGITFEEINNLFKETKTPEALDLQKLVENNLKTKFSPETITTLKRQGYNMTYTTDGSIKFIKDLDKGNQVFVFISKEGDYSTALINKEAGHGPILNKGDFNLKDKDGITVEEINNLYEEAKTKAASLEAEAPTLTPEGTPAAPSSIAETYEQVVKSNPDLKFVLPEQGKPYHSEIKLPSGGKIVFVIDAEGRGPIDLKPTTSTSLMEASNLLKYENLGRLSRQDQSVLDKYILTLSESINALNELSQTQGVSEVDKKNLIIYIESTIKGIEEQYGDVIKEAKDLFPSTVQKAGSGGASGVDLRDLEVENPPLEFPLKGIADGSYHVNDIGEVVVENGQVLSIGGNKVEIGKMESGLAIYTRMEGSQQYNYGVEVRNGKVNVYKFEPQDLKKP